MLKRTIAVVAILLGIGVNSAQAALWCNGVISQVGLHTDGTLFAQYGAGWHPYCSVNGDVTVTVNDSGAQWTITVEMCEKLYAMFLTSRSTGRTVTFAYNTSAIASCSDLGTWGWTAVYPYWVELD